MHAHTRAHTNTDTQRRTRVRARVLVYACRFVKECKIYAPQTDQGISYHTRDNPCRCRTVWLVDIKARKSGPFAFALHVLVSIHRCACSYVCTCVYIRTCEYAYVDIGVYIHAQIYIYRCIIRDWPWCSYTREKIWHVTYVYVTKDHCMYWSFRPPSVVLACWCFRLACVVCASVSICANVHSSHALMHAGVWVHTLIYESVVRQEQTITHTNTQDTHTPTNIFTGLHVKMNLE